MRPTWLPASRPRRPPDAQASAGPGPAASGHALADPRLLGAQRQALARRFATARGNQETAALLAGLQVARQPAAPAAPLDQLKKLLDDDKEKDAITLMGTLSLPDVATVLNSAEYQKLAVSSFDNDEMYRGVKAMKGDLKRSLIWMFDEGTDVAKVRDVINNATAGHDQVRASMRAQFVDLCDNKEMAAMVDLLKGDLAFKLDWMREEGTSWSLVRPKIIVAPEAEKAVIRASADWRAFFVDICDIDDMGLAVQLLGGDLEWKLGGSRPRARTGSASSRSSPALRTARRRRSATARRGRPSSSRSATTRRWPRSSPAWAGTSSGGSARCGGGLQLVAGGA